LAVIDDQNTNRNVAPAVTTIVVTRLMTVAAWVRFTAPTRTAHGAEADRGREQDDVGADEVLGAGATEGEHQAVTGIDASSSRNTHDRADGSLPG
jgi:hypothetical protein